MSEYFPVIADPERIAQLMAHRACIGVEHDPANGKLHGYCVVCGVPWPCDYAGKPPAATQEQPAGSGASEALHHAIRLLKVLPKPIYKDYDDIRRECEELISWYHAEYGTARPSSAPVGEQK